MKLFLKISNLCNHNTSTLRTERQTDRQTTCHSNTALCVASRGNNKLSGKNIHTTNYQYSESTSEICHQKQCLLAVVHVMDGLHVNNDRKTCSYWLVSSYIGMRCRLVMGWVGILNNRTDIVIFWPTDTDTNISIWNTEKYQIPTTKYQNIGSVLQVGFEIIKKWSTNYSTYEFTTKCKDFMVFTRATLC